MFDPVVLRSKQLTMQRMMFAVAQGYTYWIGGQVSADRALRLSEKFSTVYHCDCSTNARYRRKKKGLANTRLFLYPTLENKAFDWWLLCTSPGGLENGDREQWRLCTTKSGRIRWGAEYELLRLPYTAALAKTYRDKGIERKEGWTWRMQREYFEAWRIRLRSAVVAEKNHNAGPGRQALYSLLKSAGFRAVRAQVYDLRNYYNRCRRAAGLAPQDFPHAPSWLRPKTCNNYPLSVLVKRFDDGSLLAQ